MPSFLRRLTLDLLPALVAVLALLGVDAARLGDVASSPGDVVWAEGDTDGAPPFPGDPSDPVAAAEPASVPVPVRETRIPAIPAAAPCASAAGPSYPTGPPFLA